MFTRQQIEEIRKGLALYSKKDTQFDAASLPIDGSEEIAFVQNGKNVKMNLKELMNNLLLFRASDFINLSSILSNKFTLEEAIKAIPSIDRKVGVVITYIDKNIDDWVIFQYKSKSISDWFNLEYWKSILDEGKFKGYFANECLLYSICPAPQIGDYAFVGDTLGTAVIYRCINNAVWSVTDESALDYVKIIVAGDITVGENGNWFQNGVDTGIKAQGPKGEKGDSIKGDKGDTPVMRLDKSAGYVQYSYDGINWKNLVPLVEFVINNSINNSPDNEDITFNDNNKLKLADKSYDVAKFSGFGRKYLRKNIQHGKNILTQEMINKENTIYIIQYDYDLNGVEINIPNNCILQFEGGSFKNGTINGNLYDIDAQRFKIFENINIKGAARLNNYYLIDWWITTPQYQFIKENNTIDNYQDIQSAFNCGAENFIFSSDRYYYIKHTLLINGEINIFSDVEHKHYDGNDRAHRKEPPCIYSNEIITLIEYKYKSDTYKGTIYIGTINLVCNKPFSDLSEKDIPILYIHADQNTVNNTVWGVVIKCNIKAKDLTIDLKNEYPDIYEQSVNIYAPNYTGLMIKADYTNFSYIKIYSYICMTYYGIIIPNTENNKWITDITIEGDTRCVIGGKFIGGGNPVRIFGSHQPEYALAKTDEIRNVGYFVGNYIQLYGYIWDINQDTLESRGNCPKFPIQITSNKGDYNNPLIDNTVKHEILSGYRGVHLNYRNINIQAVYSDNLLNYIDSEQFKKIIKDFSLTIDGVSYKEKTNIYNSRYLFGQIPHLSLVRDDSLSCYPQAYIIKESNEPIEYKLKFKIEAIVYNILWDIIIKFNDKNCHIKYTNLDGEIVYDNDVDISLSYYQYAAFLLHISVGGNLEITMHIDGKIGDKKLLPLVKIPWNLQIYSNIEAKDSAINKGEFVYNVNTNKAGWWNGTEWVDNNGYSVKYITKGITSERPTLTNADDGFEYYDTILKKKILWNGIAWVNMDGTVLA